MENLAPLIRRSRVSLWCSWALMSTHEHKHQGDRSDSDVPCDLRQGTHGPGPLTRELEALPGSFDQSRYVTA